MADAQAARPDAITVTINDHAVSAEPGELVIDVAERNGIYIPRFCYHHRMRPVGMCRMCVVDIDTGRGPALLPACTAEAAPDMVVDTESDATKKAQDGVLEFLLVNHPLDCPVCDKGGECPLQDQTIAYGPGESRYVEPKRHFAKPIPISETVFLDRERCILCDRCTRFALEVAGDPLITFVDRGSHTQVNTFPDEPFTSYFSGNTVQICPVGALTARPYRFKARPWDLQESESTCTTCSVGCRISVQSSHDRVLRYLGVDADPVNWGWLCDKGRFGFEAIDHPDRLAAPQLRSSASAPLTEASWPDALAAAAEALAAADADRVAVLGGARLTNEDAYAWAKLAKGIVGTDHVDAQMGDGLDAELVFALPRATIDQACEPGGTVLLLAPDLKEELPVLYLRLRQAASESDISLVEVSGRTTGLTPYTDVSLQHAPGKGADLLAASLGTSSAADAEALGVTVQALTDAGRALVAGPLTVVLGRGSLAESADFVARCVGVVAERVPDARYLPVLRRANVMGALDMGLSPGFLPGRAPLDQAGPALSERWAQVPAEPGLGAAGMLSAAAVGKIDVLVLLGADPLADFPDGDLAARALDGAKSVIALDLFMTSSVERADVVLPAAGPAECDGTTTNLEGRVTTVAQRVNPPGTARSDWMIAADLAGRLGADLGVASLGDIQAEIAAVSSLHRDLAAPVDDREGVIVAGNTSGAPRVAEATGTPPRPDAYSLRLVSARSLYDDGTLVQHASSLAGLAAGAVVTLNPHDFDQLGVADGDDIRVTSARGALTAPARSDAGVPRGALAVPFNPPGEGGSDLFDGAAAVTEVRVETP